MNKAQEDLKAILDLLAEWRQENGVKYVYMSIIADGSGSAYTFDLNGKDIELESCQYAPLTREAETPAAGTAGESK